MVICESSKETSTSDLLSDLIKIRNMFCTEIGIPNANTEKRERLITDEVNSNNAETSSIVSLWLTTMREDIERVNALFGLDLNVTYKFKGGIEDETSIGLSSDAVSL